MNDRRCPACATIKDVCLFEENPDGTLHRDCIPCEQARAERRRARQARALPKSPEFRGVDIDRIHHIRGAVRKKAAA